MSRALSAFQVHARILLAAVGLAWALEIVDETLLGRSLDSLGIRPRDLTWLWGILLAPLLHGSFGHLLANTVPFLVLGWLVLVRKTADFVVVTAGALLVGGLGVWLFGAPRTVHIGASGLVFGYLGYLLVRGYLERTWQALSIALLVGVLYGSALWGLLPTQPGISWEGHASGFAGGAAAARMLVRRRPLPGRRTPAGGTGSAARPFRVR
jgi:membrane associated rhomboid family serine protease